MVRKKIKAQSKPAAHLDGALALVGGGQNVASYETADVRQRAGDAIARAVKDRKVEPKRKRKADWR